MQVICDGRHAALDFKHPHGDEAAHARRSARSRPISPSCRSCCGPAAGTKLTSFRLVTSGAGRMQLRSGGNYASPCNPNPCGRCGDLVQRARCCIGTGHNFNSTGLPYGLSTPVTSTVTNCMMLCNSQVANCQAGCFVPAPPVPPSTTASTFPTPILNATVNPACTTGCTSVQLACQTNCDRQASILGQ